MTQVAKVVDITKTYLPIDPDSYPDNREYTRREDYPEMDEPVAAYEGANFLPTAYGYKSYFGMNAIIDLEALTSRIDDCFLVQTDTYENILVALCEDGIWTKQGSETGAWDHTVTLDIPAEGSHENWTRCTIGKSTFMYRRGLPSYYSLSATPTPYVVDSFPGVTITSVNTYNSVEGIPAGDYEVCVAYFNEDGALSAPGPAISHTLATTSYAEIKFQTIEDILKYRIYVKYGTTQMYYDVAHTGVVWEYLFFDIYTSTPNNPPQAVTLPDTSWLPLENIPPFGITAETPNFLNMEGQEGIFKAGSRLGFWDSANSISWSSIDDYTDFTPSLTSLAGSAIFSDVVGRITSILSFAEGFVIYATKSIVHVSQAVSTTFQWEPKVLLSGSGVALPMEVCQSFPDNTHFAYTTTGIHKISSQGIEVIIPEVYDLLKEAAEPIGLQVLNGRYLFFKVIDPDYISGLVQTSIHTVPAMTYHFDGSESMDNLSDPFTYYPPEQVCYTMQALQAGGTSQQQAAAESARIAAGKPEKGSGLYIPYFKAYLSPGNSQLPENIEWTMSPCGMVGPSGKECKMSPGLTGNLNNISQNDIGKIPSEGTHWNIDLFVATQLAIWKQSDANRKNFINAILNRAESDSAVINEWVTTDNSVSSDFSLYACRAPADPVNVTTPIVCNLGSYITDMSMPSYGYNGCSFWLTRYATGIIDIRVRGTNVTSCESSAEITTYGFSPTPGQVRFSLGTAVDEYYILYPAFKDNPAFHPAKLEPNFASNKDVAPYIVVVRYADTNSIANSVLVWNIGNTSKKYIQTLNIHNEGYNARQGVFGVDTAFLELVGWTYADFEGKPQELVVGNRCTRPDAPSTPYKSPTKKYQMAVDDNNGTICGIPFTPVTVDGIGNGPIVWPAVDVEVPESAFMLQEGSIGPIYPTYRGAFVYDMHLKKWGKFIDDYKVLIDYSPINDASTDIIPYSTFGMNAGCVSTDGYIYLFDHLPKFSYLKYGKVGYYRLGMTDMEEVKVMFRDPCTGYLEVETSLDGQNVETALTQVQAYTNETQVTGFGKFSGRWHNINLRGNFDITNIEFRGHTTSRR